MLRIVACDSVLRANDAHEVALEQRDAGALHRDVGPGAHGDARPSAGARAGASLTPSPAMATTRPSSCRRLTTAALSSGNTSATTSSMPSSPADGLGRRLAVAGQHHDADAGRLQRLQRLRRRRLDGVRDRDEAGQLAVDADEDDRGRLLALRFRRRVPGWRCRCRARPGTWRCPRR